jgi:hypothetical protein
LAQVIEYLPSKHKALSSTPRYCLKKKKNSMMYAENKGIGLLCFKINLNLVMILWAWEFIVGELHRNQI